MEITNIKKFYVSLDKVVNWIRVTISDRGKVEAVIRINRTECIARNRDLDLLRSLYEAIGEILQEIDNDNKK